MSALRTSSVGTQGFQAPEILRILDDAAETSEYTHAVDMWSLGCVLYYLSCRRPPFTNRELWLYCQRIHRFPDSDLRNARISSTGIESLRSMLAINPSDRPTAGKALRLLWFSQASALDSLSTKAEESETNGPFYHTGLPSMSEPASEDAQSSRESSITISRSELLSDQTTLNAQDRPLVIPKNKEAQLRTSLNENRPLPRRVHEPSKHKASDSIKTQSSRPENYAEKIERWNAFPDNVVFVKPTLGQDTRGKGHGQPSRSQYTPDGGPLAAPDLPLTSSSERSSITGPKYEIDEPSVRDQKLSLTMRRATGSAELKGRLARRVYKKEDFDHQKANEPEETNQDLATSPANPNNNLDNI